MESPHSSDVRLVEVYWAKNVLQAHILKSALDDEGIRAFVEGDMLQIAMGESPMGCVTAPRIMVCQSDAGRAQEVLQRFDAHHAAK